MKNAWLSVDVFYRIAARASLGAVNALLRSCHELSRMHVTPPRLTKIYTYGSGKAGVHVLSNGVRDGLATYACNGSTLTITYRRGHITRWSLTSVHPTIMYGSPIDVPTHLHGVANTRAWLCIPHGVSERHIMRWLVTKHTTIDANPITGSVSVSRNGTAGKGRVHSTCAYIAPAHRVYDERARIDIAGLTAWMTDIAAHVEPSIERVGDVPPNSFEWFATFINVHQTEFARRG